MDLDVPSTKTRTGPCGSRACVATSAPERTPAVVRVGDDCVLDPHTVTTSDLPARKRVRILMQCQVTVQEPGVTVTGVRLCPRKITVWGNDLLDVLPALVSQDGGTLPLSVEVGTSLGFTAMLPGDEGGARPDLALLDPVTRTPRVLVPLQHLWRQQDRQTCESCPTGGTA